MFKKARKFIKKDIQRRYEQLEERFLKFETRLYGRLEERMERLENQFDQLSNLIKDSMGGDENEKDVAEQEVPKAEEKKEEKPKAAAKEEKKEKKKPKATKKSKAKKTATKKETTKTTTPKADDLKALKGIGPALEKQLKEAGISSLQQMTELTDNDIEALDAQVSGFKQRYERYDWRTLAKEALEK